jgi:hypothetical protein
LAGETEVLGENLPQCRFVNLSTFKSKLISKTDKIQVYKTLIRPVATYGAETWTLTVTDENALRMFERKIVRRIYAPVMENNVWRIRYNEDLNTLMNGEDIVRFIKSQRIRWLGHFETMEDNAMQKRMLTGRLYSKGGKEDLG